MARPKQTFYARLTQQMKLTKRKLRVCGVFMFGATFGAVTCMYFGAATGEVRYAIGVAVGIVVDVIFCLLNRHFTDIKDEIELVMDTLDGLRVPATLGSDIVPDISSGDPIEVFIMASPGDPYIPAGEAPPPYQLLAAGHV